MCFRNNNALDQCKDQVTSSQDAYGDYGYIAQSELEMCFLDELKQKHNFFLCFSDLQCQILYYTNFNGSQ